ncbi:MAG: radical SAM protein [Spirochaetales bacterium]|nr:radical SAM protein [Spirochaetales bacterium]
MYTYKEKETTTIINVKKFIDPWFWDRYSISPYAGCEFNCIYCYARAGKYAQHFNQGNTIYIKKDAPQKLDRRLTRTKTLLPDIVGMSGVCDPYQPGELVYKNTRACIEVLAKHHYPVNILTKSALVVRDRDLFSQIAEKSWMGVSFTVTTLNETIARFLEPSASTPEERLAALSTIKKANPKINCGVMAIPMVPGLEDDEKEIEEFLKRSKDAGADFFLFSPGLTMEGSQALRFLAALQSAYPHLIPFYENLFKFSYSPHEYSGTYGPKKSYATGQSKKIFTLLDKYNLPARLKRFIPEDFRKNNYLIAEQLLNEACHLQYLGKSCSNLYWAGMNIQNLKEDIHNITARNELKTIRNVNDEVEKKILALLEK